MSNLLTYLNLFESFKRYISEEFLGIEFYCNPVAIPSTSASSFMIIDFSDEVIGKLSHTYPRIFAVAKSDPNLTVLSGLVSQIVEKFSSPSSGKKSFSLYDVATEQVVGLIMVEDVRPRMVLPYEEGYVSRAIDIHLTYQVSTRHL